VNYSNHARYVPAFHFVALPILLANFVYRAYQLRWGLSFGSGLAVATALALVLVALYARTFAMTVQDRVIRLEMRLRLREILPADMHGKIVLLSPRQLVGLRFASDAELPALVAQVTKDNIADAGAIKKMIKDWQADNLRA